LDYEVHSVIAPGVLTTVYVCLMGRFSGLLVVLVHQLTTKLGCDCW